MARGVGLDRWRQHIQGIHRLMIAVEVMLHHLHRFELFEASLLCHLVLAFIGIMFQVTHIGDVAHISHLIAQMIQIPVKDIECDSRACVSQMTVAVHSGAAHIHSHTIGMDGFENLLCTRH